MSICVATTGFQMPYVPPPGPPLNLVASASSSSQITLSWSAAAVQPGTSIAQYTVYRQTDGVNYPPVGQTSGLTFSDSGLNALTTYTYQVVATDSKGAVSASSGMASATTLSPVPAAPTGLQVTGVSSSSVTLSWGTVSGAVSYNLYRNNVEVQNGLLSTIATDTGLTASTAYTYKVSAQNAAGEGPQSTAVIGTTSAQTVSSGAIPFAPGHYVRTGTNGNSTTPISGSLTTCLSYMDAAIAADINNQIKGFVFPFKWGNLESAAGGVYDGSWDSSGNSGFAIVQALINKAKTSYNPPRSITLTLNCTGNGMNSNALTSYPSSFAPSYLNSPTYSGGVAYNGDSSSYTGQPVVKFWKAAVAGRLVSLVQAYYNHFGPDTATGGVYMFDPFNEISIDPNTGYTTTEFLATLQSTLLPGPTSGLRGVAPSWMFFFRPTFLQAGPNNQQYQTLFGLMQSSYIAMGEEDSTNKVSVSGATLTAAQQHPYDNWGALAYRGISTFNGGTQQTWPNHATAGDWTFVCNVEDAELGRGANTTAVPPATFGSGYLLNSQTFPGIMNGAATIGASHVIWYLDCFTAGPNVNRGPKITAAGAPANPTGGPAPGSTATLPNLVSVITGNTAYAGITGPMVIPSTTYPPSWPSSAVSHGQSVTITGSGFGNTMPVYRFAGGLGGPLESATVGSTPNEGANNHGPTNTPNAYNWDRFGQTAVIRSDSKRGNVFGLTGVNSEACHEYAFPAQVGFSSIIYIRYMSRYLTSLGTDNPDCQVKLTRVCCGTSNVSDTGNGFFYHHYNHLEHGHMLEMGIPNTSDNSPDHTSPDHETWYFGGDAGNTSLENIFDGAWRVSEIVVKTNSTLGAFDGKCLIRAISSNFVPGFPDPSPSSVSVSPEPFDGNTGGHDLTTQFRTYILSGEQYLSVIWQNFSSNGMNPLDFCIDDHFVMFPPLSNPLVVEFWYSLTPSSRGLTEVQPPTSWADGSITVKFNKGGIPSGTTGWIVVRNILTDAVVASRQVTVN